MSEILRIKRANGAVTRHRIGSTSHAPVWIAEVGRKQGFRELDGTLPWPITPRNLEQILREAAALREDLRQRQAALPQGGEAEAGYASVIREWDAMLEDLARLRSESGWDASFG